MKTHTKTLLTALTASAMLAGSVNAAVITPTATYGFTSTNLSKVTDGSGVTKGDTDDVTTWDVVTPGTFADESFDNPLAAATNSKLGWYALDLGSDQDLDELYVAMGAYIFGGSTLTLGSFNVYLADTPTAALSNGGDYDFASGGWTQIGGTTTFASAASDTVIDLSGNSAQFVAIEIMSDFATSDKRTGVNELAVTAIPEPGSLALLGLGGLLIGARRRRG